MSTPLDTAVLLGKESAYGTPVALSHAYEAQSDPWQRQQAYLESRGFRAGSQGVRSDRRKVVNMGAEGAIQADLMDRGMGFLFQGLLGTTTGPTEGATGVYTSTHESATEDAGVSYTVQVLRPMVGGALQPFTYAGAVPTGWSISHSVEGLAVLNVDFDAQDEDTATPAGTPTYADGALPFDWTEADITVGGTPVDASEFEFSADLGLKTDRRFIRKNAKKKRPVRQTVPTYEGSISQEFENTDAYDDFVAGSVLDLVATWEGGLIAGSDNFKVTLTLAAIQYEGETPNANLDDVSMQSLPYKVLHNGTDPMVKVELQSDDAAF